MGPGTPPAQGASARPGGVPHFAFSQARPWQVCVKRMQASACTAPARPEGPRDVGAALHGPGHAPCPRRVCVPGRVAPVCPLAGAAHACTLASTHQIMACVSAVLIKIHVLMSRFMYIVSDLFVLYSIKTQKNNCVVDCQCTSGSESISLGAVSLSAQRCTSRPVPHKAHQLWPGPTGQRHRLCLCDAVPGGAPGGRERATQERVQQWRVKSCSLHREPAPRPGHAPASLLLPSRAPCRALWHSRLGPQSVRPATSKHIGDQLS